MADDSAEGETDETSGKESTSLLRKAGRAWLVFASVVVLLVSAVAIGRELYIRKIRRDLE